MDEKILKERERYEAFEKKRFAEETIEEENKQSIHSFYSVISVEYKRSKPPFPSPVSDLTLEYKTYCQIHSTLMSLLL